MKPYSLLVLLAVGLSVASCSKSNLSDREKKELRGNVKEVLTVSFDIRVPLKKNPDADYTLANLHPSASGSNLMRFDCDGRFTDRRDYFMDPDGFWYESYQANGAKSLRYRMEENGKIILQTNYDEYGYPIDEMVNTNGEEEDFLFNLLTLGLWSVFSDPPEYHGGKMEVVTDDNGHVVSADNGLHRYDYTYDAAGRILTRRYQNYKSGTWRVGESTRNTYSADGLLLRSEGTESGDSIHLVYEYDTSGRMTQTERYKFRNDTAHLVKRTTCMYGDNGTAPAAEDIIYENGSTFHYSYKYRLDAKGDTVLIATLYNDDDLGTLKVQNFENGARYIRTHLFKSRKMNAELHERDKKGRDIAYRNEKDSVVARFEYDADGFGTVSRDNVNTMYGLLNITETRDTYGRTTHYETRKTEDDTPFYSIAITYEGEGNRDYVSRAHFDVTAYGNSYDNVSTISDGHLVQSLYIQNGDTVLTDYIYNHQNDDSVHVSNGEVEETYDYEYDSYGNWTRRNTYDAQGYCKKVEFRSLQYYK